MPSFTRLIRFESADNGQIYFADLGADVVEPPSGGTQVKAYASLDDLLAGKAGKVVSLDKLLAPLPHSGIPIYCVGLNYRTHAEEAKLPVPANPPLWTKPAAALAAPNEDIPINKFCASSFPDYEASVLPTFTLTSDETIYDLCPLTCYSGELVFVTSRECRDLSPEESESYILGYTAGNDLSCRLHQLREQSGGQFFFAKAFDKFAPLGPVLISPEVFGKGEGLKLITRVNGEVMQESECMKDFIWTPAKILSHMSQGTTIPAGTAVMTGTPSGVGAFKNPKRFLKNDDVVEVDISSIGVLRNKIAFQ